MIGNARFALVVVVVVTCCGCGTADSKSNPAPPDNGNVTFHVKDMGYRLNLD